MTAQARNNIKSWKARVITVSGGKGGTGKTFFTVNLAVELKSRGYKVLIFDADLNLSNVHLLLNIDENKSFRDFLENKVDIFNIIQKGVGGVDVVYVGDEIQRMSDIFNINEEEYKSIIDGLEPIGMEYDFILIDTAAGLNELNIRLIINSDRAVLIANPELTSLVDLYRVIKICAARKKRVKFELVINKAYSAEGAFQIFRKISETVSRFNLKTSISLLGYILEDSRRVFESIQKRTPLVILHNSGPLKQCFDLITSSFLGKEKPGRVSSFINRLIVR